MAREEVYVDDYLEAVNSIEDVVEQAVEVKLENGDFNLGHCVSNDSRLLEAVRSGIVWDPATDML